MNRPSPLLWLGLLLLLLLPTAAGRVLLDLLGGLMLAVLAIPLVLTGLGWIGWKVLQSRARTCSACGAVSMTPTPVCTVCGTPFETGTAQGQSTPRSPGIPASETTIDVTAQDVDDVS